MALPREILHRAARERAQAPQRPPAASVEPRPATPLPVEPAPDPSVPAPPLRRAPVGGHANYSALMRSHDRLRTNHLPRTSPGSGA